MGDFIPQAPSLGTGAGRAQWAQKPGGASGIARSDTCGATMRVPRFSPQTPSSLRAYRSFLSENSISSLQAFVMPACFISSMALRLNSSVYLLMLILSCSAIAEQFVQPVSRFYDIVMYQPCLRSHGGNKKVHCASYSAASLLRYAPILQANKAEKIGV